MRGYALPLRSLLLLLLLVFLAGPALASDGAREIMERVLHDFAAQFATTSEPEVHLGYYEVDPKAGGVAVKDVLPKLFSAEPGSH